MTGTQEPMHDIPRQTIETDSGNNNAHAAGVDEVGHAPTCPAIVLGTGTRYSPDTSGVGTSARAPASESTHSTHHVHDDIINAMVRPDVSPSSSFRRDDENSCTDHETPTRQACRSHRDETLSAMSSQCRICLENFTPSEFEVCTICYRLLLGKHIVDIRGVHAHVSAQLLEDIMIGGCSQGSHAPNLDITTPCLLGPKNDGRCSRWEGCPERRSLSTAMQLSREHGHCTQRVCMFMGSTQGAKSF